MVVSVDIIIKNNIHRVKMSIIHMIMVKGVSIIHMKMMNIQELKFHKRGAKRVVLSIFLTQIKGNLHY